MDRQALGSTARQWIAGFDSNAHRAIGAWREGGDRLGGFARDRWDTAFAQAKPKLSPETRRNASHARDVVSGLYAKGIVLAAGGAETAVDTLVDAARAAVDRALAARQAGH
ncbi:MAG: hypothetical protein K0R89_687 [Ramlibacter sp.]|nr:hypothetical protein [Ramlibacter sp.]